MSITWDYPKPFTVDMTVSTDDIDVMNHVNNAAYLKWLERIAWQHSNTLGLDWDAYLEHDCALVAQRTELDYLKASFAGELLRLATWITENDGRMSITREYQIVRVSDEQNILRGKTRWVCVQPKSGKVRRMPELYKRSYAPTHQTELGEQ